MVINMSGNRAPQIKGYNYRNYSYIYQTINCIDYFCSSSKPHRIEVRLFSDLKLILAVNKKGSVKLKHNKQIAIEQEKWDKVM